MKLPGFGFNLEGAMDLLKDLSKLFDGVVNSDEQSAKFFSDIILIVLNENDEEIRRFYCHGYILASRSPVFERIFANKEWKESGVDNEERFVEIKGIEAPILEHVLRYIYTGYLLPKDNPDLKTLEASELIKIVDVAEKYFLYKLKEICLAHLIYFNCDDCQRAQQILWADQYNAPQLKAVCIAALSSNFEGIKADYNISHELSTEIRAASLKRFIDTEQITLEDAECSGDESD
jgi:BTB/POZ domain